MKIVSPAVEDPAAHSTSSSVEEMETVEDPATNSIPAEEVENTDDANSGESSTAADSEQPSPEAMEDAGKSPEESVRSAVDSEEAPPPPPASPSVRHRRGFNRLRRFGKIPVEYLRRTDGRYACQYCSRVLRTRNSILRHCQLHTGEATMFPCPQ